MLDVARGDVTSFTSHKAAAKGRQRLFNPFRNKRKFPLVLRRFKKFAPQSNIFCRSLSPLSRSRNRNAFDALLLARVKLFGTCPKKHLLWSKLKGKSVVPLQALEQRIRGKPMGERVASSAAQAQLFSAHLRASLQALQSQPFPKNALWADRAAL